MGGNVIRAGSVARKFACASCCFRRPSHGRAKTKDETDRATVERTREGLVRTVHGRTFRALVTRLLRDGSCAPYTFLLDDQIYLQNVRDSDIVESSNIPGDLSLTPLHSDEMLDLYHVENMFIHFFALS